MKVIVVLLLITISQVFSRPLNGTIVTYSSVNGFHSMIAREYDLVANIWNITGKADFKMADASATWWLKQSYIKLTNIKINAARIDSKKLNRTNVFHDEDRVRIVQEGDDAFIIEFSYNYEYSCYSGATGTGVATLISHDTEINRYTQMFETPEKKRGQTWVSVSAFFNRATEVKFDPKDKYAKDEHVLGLARQAIVKRLSESESQGGASEVLNHEIERAFNEIYAQVTNTAYLPITKKEPLIVDFMYKDYPVVLADNQGYIFYHDGSILASVPPKTSTSPDKPTWDKFDVKNGEYQVFISSFFFADIFNSFFSRKKITIDNYNMKGIGMNVNFANPFVKDLEERYPPDMQLRIESNINNFDVFEGINHFYLRGKGNFRFYAGVETTEFLNFSVDLEFTLTHILDEKNAINFYVEQNSFKVTNSIVLSDTVVKNALLEASMVKLLNQFQVENQLEIFEENIPLGDLFARENAILTIVNEGFLICGSPKALQNITKELVKLRNLRANSN